MAELQAAEDQAAEDAALQAEEEAKEPARASKEPGTTEPYGLPSDTPADPPPKPTERNSVFEEEHLVSPDGGIEIPVCITDEAKLRKEVVRLYNLLDHEDQATVGESGGVPVTKLVITCKLYDARLSIEGLMETLAMVAEANPEAGPGSMSEGGLLAWVLLVFGDCTESEVYAGLTELCDAARRSE